jgi:hypothetical protein
MALIHFLSPLADAVPLKEHVDDNPATISGTMRTF